MTKTVVASVSEPSKPEPFIESYAIQMRGETDVEGYYASRKSAERDLAEDYAPGAARLVIIPGETDDATPATEKELRQTITEAVAQAWCTPENSGKVMDADLANAAVESVLKAIAPK